jgi:hypothetical protein
MGDKDVSGRAAGLGFSSHLAPERALRPPTSAFFVKQTRIRRGNANGRGGASLPLC